MIFVQNADGQPMMPTDRAGYIRRLLASKNATVISRSPFVIRLAHQVEQTCQPLILGIDPGMTIGFAVIKESGESVLLGELETRSADIPKLMDERRMHRMARHRYRRQRTKRRAKQSGTTFDGVREFPLPGTDDEGDPLGSLNVKDIKPRLAKFANRGNSRKEGRVSPTINHLRETHIRLVDYLCSILPIDSIVIEYAAFDQQRIDHPEIEGKGYQQGPLLGYANVKQYVLERDGHLCQLCRKKSHKFLHVHHVIWRRDSGADTRQNLVTLCMECHDLVHASAATNQKLKEKMPGIRKRKVKTTLINTIMPHFEKWLKWEHDVKRTYGFLTKHARKEAKLDKTHAIDAYVIALRGTPLTGNVWPGVEEFPVMHGKQYRRNNRQEISRQPDRKYYAPDEKKPVAKNRSKREAQHDGSLKELRDSIHDDAYISQLRVVKGRHAKKNGFNAIQRGDVVRINGNTHVVRGFCGGGKSLYLEGEGKQTFSTKKATLIHRNKGFSWT